MPAGERRQRAARLRAAVEANDFHLWFERQLADLQEMGGERALR
jgi:trehalose-6-phosphate synthase